VKHKHGKMQLLITELRSLPLLLRQTTVYQRLTSIRNERAKQYSALELRLQVLFA